MSLKSGARPLWGCLAARLWGDPRTVVAFLGLRAGEKRPSGLATADWTADLDCSADLERGMPGLIARLPVLSCAATDHRLSRPASGVISP
jgi:hypothetical protein